MFELLAAATRAGIIATDLRTGPDRLGFFNRGSGFTNDVAALRSF